MDEGVSTLRWSHFMGLEWKKLLAMRRPKDRAFRVKRVLSAEAERAWLAEELGHGEGNKQC